MSNERERNGTLTQRQIEEWITNMATGKFHYTKIMDGIISPPLYPQLRAVLHRLKEKGIVYPVDGRDGWWRPADNKLEELCWWDTEGEIGENIILPLGMNKYCYIPLPSLVIVAGAYNAGKTALLINVVNANIEKWANRIHFFVSEGAEMIGTKIKTLNPFIPKPPPFKIYRKTENFSDVIMPDDLNVIDYLRVNMEQPFAVTEKLFAIFNKLHKGIAVVAMQKPPGARKLAFGGASTAFEPSLYLGMDKNYISFEKIKVPKILEHDPYHLKIEFKLSKGVNFYDIHEIYEGGDNQEV